MFDEESDRDGGAEFEDAGWGGHHHGHGPHGPGFGPGARRRMKRMMAGGPEFGGPDGPGFGPGRGFAAQAGGYDMPGFGGPPPFAGPRGFGPMHHGRGRRGGRARRGDVRAAALALLATEPMNGYQIIQQIAERSGGIWRPSPGAVYPALAQLEDENLIRQQALESGRRGYVLTDEGRRYVADHADELREPWSAMAEQGASAAAGLRDLMQQLHLAALGVVSAGTEAQIGQAREILSQARRALYRLLAEDEQSPGRGGPADHAGEDEDHAGEDAG